MSTSADVLVAVAAVALGGAAGASLRFVVETWTVARWGHSWPWGTFAVNVLGSLLLGVALGGVLVSELPRWASLLVATGFCGALTTFSSFALQVLDLSISATTSSPAGVKASDPDSAAVRFSPRGVAYAAISLGAGLLAAVSVQALMR